MKNFEQLTGRGKTDELDEYLGVTIGVLRVPLVV